MSNLIRLAVVFALMIASAGAKQQPKFIRYTNESGLSQATVFAITQDALGFLWMGTMDGLNRYDGNQFVHFRKIPFDSTSLPDHTIRSLLATDDSVLWIGTNSSGLVTLDLKSGQFHTIHCAEQKIRQVTVLIRQPQSNRIFVGSGSGLYFYQSETNELIHIGKHSFTISALAWKDVRTLLVATEFHGLWEVNVQTGVWESQVQLPKVLSRAHLKALLVDSRHEIWLGTAGYGLYRYRDREKKWKPMLLASTVGPPTIKDRTISVLYENSQRQIFVGTRRGVFIIDSSRNRQKHLIGEPENSSTLSDNSIISIFEDRGGNMWLGTWAGGVNRMIRRMGYFVHDESLPDLMGHIILSIIEDNKSHLWIGTNGRGVYRFHRDSGRLYQYTPATTAGKLADYTIQCLASGRNSRVWMGTLTKGIFVYDGLHNNWERLEHKPDLPDSPSSNNIHAMLRKGDSLFVGTSRGLDVVNLRTGGYQRLPIFATTGSAAPEILAIRSYGDGSLWIGTFQNGLFHWLPRTNRLKHYFYDEKNPSGLSSNTVWDILHLNRETVYVATAQGLNRLNLKTGLAETFLEADGLPNETIYRLEKDSQHRIWASTNNGLVMIDKIFKKHPMMYAFSTPEGLVSNEFNMGASSLLHDGSLLFGTINGLQWINPGFKPGIKREAQINVVSLDLPRSGRRPGWSVLNSSRWILHYPDNTFIVQFAVSEYGNPGATRISVYLEGEESGWSVPSSRRYFSYSNLKPGQYVLHIRAFCGMAKKFENKSIQILILPAWWQTRWFQIGMLSFIIGILVLLIWLRLRLYKQLDLFRQRVAADLHDEVGSYLTRIRMSADLWRQQKKEDVVGEFSQKILNLAEQGMQAMRTIIWTMDRRYDRMDEVQQKIRELAFSTFKNTPIDYRFHFMPMKANPVCSPLFRRNLLTILQEGFTNILKHSKASRVDITMGIEGKYLQIAICDNGIGMTLPPKHEGHGLRNIQYRVEECNGEFFVKTKQQFCLEFRFPKKRIFLNDYYIYRRR